MEANQNIQFLPNPLTLFAEWFALASASEVNDPNAMTLATAANGIPRARIVLMKDFSATGFKFFTNLESAKAEEISANAKVALCFHWKSLQRQVRITGSAAKLPAAEDDAYFASRMRMSQLGAWASAQSRPMTDMAELERRAHDYEIQFQNQPIPRPPHWGGFCVSPETIEFWAERPYRMHERMLYTKSANEWQQQRLYP